VDDGTRFERRAPGWDGIRPRYTRGAAEPPGRGLARRPVLPRKAFALSTFTEQAAAELAGPDWLRRRRVEAFGAFESLPLPSEKEEVWRYSPIDELRLEDFAPTGPSPREDGRGTVGLATQLDPTSAVVTVRDGRPVAYDVSRLPDGVMVGPATREAVGQELVGAVQQGGDALVRLNDAFVPDVVLVDVAPGAIVSAPIVIMHVCSSAQATSATAPASFPRTAVRVGRGAAVEVVEIIAGDDGGGPSLVVPVTELFVEDAAILSYVTWQVLDEAAWHVARLAGRVGRDATLRIFTAGLGGAYDRSRTDVELAGQGGSSEQRSAYLGTGDQVHDIRTKQDHLAPRTTSDLLCKGSVSDRARSIYTGLIRVERGAVRADAMQTNHNLVLDESAHADSVPNLDILENDVRCSHASTVGPLDEDQLYYVESRGVAPERAQELIVRGFFDDIVDRVPVPSVAPFLRQEVRGRLARVLASGESIP